MAHVGEYLSSSAMGKVVTTPNDPEVVLYGVRRFFDVAQEEAIKKKFGLPPGFASNRAAWTRFARTTLRTRCFSTRSP